MHNGSAHQRHQVWEHDFVDRAQQTFLELCKDPLRRERPECVELLKSPHGQHQKRAPTLEERLEVAGDDAGSWSSTFKAALREAEKEMCAQPHRRERDDCKKLMASIAEEEQQEAKHAPNSLLLSIHHVEREMCQEPHRRGRADCVELLASLDKEERLEQEAKQREETGRAARQHHSGLLEASLTDAAEDHAAWEKEIASKAERLHTQLCMEPERRNRKDCIDFLAAAASKASASSGTPVSNTTVAHGLDWSHSFIHTVRAAQREMCQEPSRRHRHDCVQLMASIAKAEREEVAKEFREHTAQLDSSLTIAAADHAVWERELASQAHKIQREMCLQPERRHSAPCERFFASTADVGHAGKAGTAEPASAAAANASRSLEDSASWTRSFMHTVRAAQREMCSDARRHHRPDCAQLLSAISKAEHEENMAELNEHVAELESDLKVAAKKHAAWEHEFEAKVQQVQRELFGDRKGQNHADPSAIAVTTGAPDNSEKKSEATSTDAPASAGSTDARHRMHDLLRKMCKEKEFLGHPSCATLLASPAKDEEKIAAAGGSLRGSVKTEAEGWAVSLQRNSAVRTVDKSRWEKQLVEKYAPAGPSATADVPQTALRQGRRQMHWSTVTGWASAGWLRSSLGSGKGHILFERKDVIDARWSGMIPKVACITAISSSRVSKSKMEQFIRNFNEQTYEGASQLALVYDQEDEAAAAMVRLYSDGARIKAVAARDEGMFPSTTALRFGAWSVGEDAEAIFHWDVEDSHHPQRLSLQVRALALSARPGSLIENDGSFREESLGGEVKWMQRHWYPLLEGQHQTLQGMQESQIVQVRLDSLNGLP